VADRSRRRLRPAEPAPGGSSTFTRIRRHWPDIQRLIVSIHTSAISAHDELRILAPGGTATQFGDALAQYGRIFKTLHILNYIDNEPYRREIKAIRNLEEGRQDLGRTAFHGRKGELRHGYRDGMEDHLGALGLVLNAVTLWNTVYLDHAVSELRAAGYPVLDGDLERLSPYMRRHINFHGHYFFNRPDLPGGRRALRDPDTPDDDSD
jgi:TnpA family transposase